MMKQWMPEDPEIFGYLIIEADVETRVLQVGDGYCVYSLSYKSHIIKSSVISEIEYL